MSRESFESLLTNPDQVRKFRLFLKRRHSDECLDFCIAVDQNANIKYLYDQFIAEKAIRPLIIDRKVQNQIGKYISENDFNNAWSAIKKIRNEVANDLVSGHYIEYRLEKSVRKTSSFSDDEGSYFSRIFNRKS